jgi:outer membrane protein assembly factor BamB
LSLASASRAFAAAAALLWAASAGAQVVISITPTAAPLRNGVTHRRLDSEPSSTLSVEVVNNNTTLRLRVITFRFPNGWTVTGAGTAPPGWAVTLASGRDIEFTAGCLPTEGLAPLGGTGTFTMEVLSRVANNNIDNDASQTLTITGTIGDRCPGGGLGWSRNNPTFMERVLSVGVQSAPASTLVGPASASVAWNVQNRSGASKTVVLENRTVPGLTASCDPASVSVASGADGTFTCAYANVPAGSYTLAASASAGATATALGSTVSFRVGTAHVSWARPVAVAGRPPHGFTITAFNESDLNVSRVEVIPPAGWTGPTALSGGSGLGPGTGCVAGAACFTGNLAAGGTATLSFQFSGDPGPAQTTPSTFTVRLTPASGASADFAQVVTLFVPPPDVAGLTVLSDVVGGQTLSWSNTSRPDAPHDGVVVFRTAAPAVPPLPQDFVDYTLPGQPPEVFYADSGGSTVRDLTDPALGAFHYRVCNRDASLVYSGCRSGFWNAEGYADSVATSPYPWSHQLGGEALQLPTIVTALGLVAIPTNRPEIAVLNLATGERAFDPVPLPALPSSSTPATRVVDGRLLLFAADASGTVTAIDLEAGQVAWQRPKLNESFVAGVSGITRAYGAPAFQAAYPMDVLLLGSTSGNVLAIDATNGDTLWTVDAGAPVRALVNYDSGTNRFYVPTDGGGVLAFDMSLSGPSEADPADPVQGWANPGGVYSLYCAKGFEAGTMACIDIDGVLRVLDGETGEVRASRATELSSPGTLVRVAGATPGFVVGDADAIQRLVATGSPYTLERAGIWSAGPQAISSALILSVSGYIIVASSDGSLHELRLADAQWVSQTVAVPSATGAVELGPIAYDTVDHLYVFGTAEGRVWAIPTF